MTEDSLPSNSGGRASDVIGWYNASYPRPKKTLNAEPRLACPSCESVNPKCQPRSQVVAARVRLAAQDKTETCPSGPKGASGSPGLPHTEPFDSRTDCLRQNKAVERVLTYMDAYRIPVVVSWHFFCMLQIQAGLEDHGQDRSYKFRWSGSETHCKAEAGEEV